MNFGMPACGVLAGVLRRIAFSTIPITCRGQRRKEFASCPRCGIRNFRIFEANPVSSTARGLGESRLRPPLLSLPPRDFPHSLSGVKRMRGSGGANGVRGDVLHYSSSPFESEAKTSGLSAFFHFACRGGGTTTRLAKKKTTIQKRFFSTAAGSFLRLDASWRKKSFLNGEVRTTRHSNP